MGTSEDISWRYDLGQRVYTESQESVSTIVPTDLERTLWDIKRANSKAWTVYSRARKWKEIKRRRIGRIRFEEINFSSTKFEWRTYLA